MKNKFKVGDKVRRLHNENGKVKVGDIGTVIEVIPQLNGDPWVKLNIGIDTIHNPDHLELVEYSSPKKETPNFIVLYCDGGTPNHIEFNDEEVMKKWVMDFSLKYQACDSTWIDHIIEGKFHSFEEKLG